MRLKYQIEQVVSCEVEEGLLTDPNSRIITDDVVKTSRNAGGEDYAATVVYCLLVCLRWFQIQASNELWDADLHEVRAVACEVIAKRMYVPASPNFYHVALPIPAAKTSIVLRQSQTRTIY